MNQMGLTKKLLHLMKIPQVYNKEWLQEQKVIEYIKSVIPTLKQDKTWNLYLINKNTPMICAHMDTVWWPEAQKVLNNIRVVKPWEDTGRKNEKWQKTTNILQSSIIVWDMNIWADDKCWLAIALELYEKLWNKISLLFTVWEEIGWVWISWFDKKLFNDINYVIIPDRKWGSDIIWVDNDYCTQLFENKIYEFSKDYWYQPAMWVWSDCDTISDHLNCVNMSCWYYNAHTDKEFVVINEFENCYNAILNIVENFNERLEKPVKEFSRYSRMWWVYWYDYWYDYWNELEPIEMLDYDSVRVSWDLKLSWPNWEIINLKSWVYYILDEDVEDERD